MNTKFKQKKIALFGSTGRMGKAIFGLAEGSNFQIGVSIDLDTNKETIKKGLSQCDVAIEFINAPEKSVENALLCLEYKIPLIIGTTGHSSDDLKQIEKISKNIPILLTSNTSIGINLIMELVKKASEFLDDTFDTEIIEAHHRNKIDSPSGTALSILDTINKTKNEKNKNVFGRKGKSLRKKGEIGIHAVRGGLITGEHEVRFVSDFEEISISHRAFDRKVFAKGALRAASFIINQKPGFFTMKDVING